LPVQSHPGEKGRFHENCPHQETGNPVFASVADPRKGLTPEKITSPMLEIVKDILPGMELVT